jgi:hypothetical protein
MEFVLCTHKRETVSAQAQSQEKHMEEWGGGEVAHNHYLRHWMEVNQQGRKVD